MYILKGDESHMVWMAVEVVVVVNGWSKTAALEIKILELVQFLMMTKTLVCLGNKRSRKSDE